MKPLKDKVITFRVEEEQYIKLQKIAEERDRTIAYLINKICEEYLRENKSVNDLVFSYKVGNKKVTELITQYPKEQLAKLRFLEEKCNENKCTILDLLDFLLKTLTLDDLERIPTEYNSGYLFEKYGIE